MKKHLSFLLLALATFGFVACSDVPAPYGIPTGPVSKVKVPPYSESFSSSLGKFQSVLQSGSGSWVSKSGYAMATGKNGTDYIAGNYYLISPEIDLTGLDTAHVSYQYIVAYRAADENQKVMISDNYSSKNKPADADWLCLKSKHEYSTGKPDDWNAFNTADITIPKSMLGKIVRIAFVYNCGDAQGNVSTWEVKNFSIQEGKGKEDSEEDGSKPIEFKDFCNGDFETWVNDSLAFNWETKSAARTCKTVKSTDAHAGSYAIHMLGANVTNKRLGYKEMKMEPGTYSVSFWAKSDATANGKLRPGYAVITDYSVQPTLTYAESGTEITQTAWTNITYTFTLTQTATVSLVIQNQKKNLGAIVDDYTITKQP